MTSLKSYTIRTQTLPSFWVYEESEEGFYAFFNDVLNECTDLQQRVIDRDTLVRDFYEGNQFFKSVARRDPMVSFTKDNKKSRITINITESLVNDLLIRITAGSRAISVYPANSQEHEDRLAAKVSQQFIDSLWNGHQKIDEALQRHAEYMLVYGDAILEVTYDPYMGDMQPGVAQELEQGTFDPLYTLTDLQGEPVTGEDGEALTVETVPRTGEVSWSNVPRRRIILEPGKENFESCDYVIIINKMTHEEITAKYPTEKERTYYKNSSPDISLNISSEWEQCNENECYVYTFYHRGTEFLDSGKYVKFTSERILEEMSLVEAVGHRTIPLVWTSYKTSHSFPYSQGLVSRLMTIQMMINNIESILYHNIILTPHPYWLSPRGAKLTEGVLNNDATVIEFSGNQAPVLVKPNTIDAALFSMIERLNAMAKKVAGVQEISEGQVPARSDSAPIVRALEEIEARKSSLILKAYDSAIIKTAKLCLSTAGYFYKATDGRTLRVLGKGGELTVAVLDVAVLSGIYDIKIERGISTSFSGRVAQIQELEKIRPGLIPDEQLLSLLELGDITKYQDLITVAIQSAERENSLLSEGAIVAAPLKWEEHEQHWYTLIKHMQHPLFKEETSRNAEILANFISHGQGHEMFILDKLMNNPAYAQKFLAIYPYFPVFLTEGVMQPVFGMLNPAPVPLSEQQV
jgi:hypothetical protein